jgi:hypothetical protein
VFHVGEKQREWKDMRGEKGEMRDKVECREGGRESGEKSSRR